MVKRIVSLCMMMIMGVVLSGCNLTEAQIKVISQNAGLGAAVTWIAYDNPTPEVKAVVKTTLDIIATKAGEVQLGKTYTEIIYPEIETVVQSGIIDDQYKPIVLAGSLAMLNGIDMLFALHPEWKIQQEKAVAIVNSFILGAKQGLSLSDRDPVIVQAKAMNERRARVFKQ